MKTRLRVSRFARGHFYLALVVALQCAAPVLAQEDPDDFDGLFGDTSTPEAPAQEPEKSADSKSPDVEKEPETAVIVLPESTPVANRPPQRRAIEEIVVTAQKTEQTLQEVPVSVSAVSADVMRKAGIFGPEGIENQVPNLEMDMDPQAPSIGIRGFSTDSFNVGLEPSVGIIIDELSIGRTEFIPDGMFDMQGIEVLRGPQGTLFGKNTIAGVLILSSAAPEDEPGGQLLLTLGSGDELRAEGGLSVPLTDDLLSRFAFTSWHKAGEVDNSFLDRKELSVDQTAGRVRLDWEVNDRLQLKFSAQLSYVSHNYPGWQLYAMDPDALEYAQSKDPQTEDNPYDAHTSFDLPAFVKRDSSIVHGVAEYALGDFLGLSDAVFTAVAGNAQVANDILFDFDVSAADLVKVKADFGYGQNSIELRLTGGADTRWGDNLEFVGGLFGVQSDLDMFVNVSVGKDLADFAATPAGAEAIGSVLPVDLPGLDSANPLGLLLNAAALPGVDPMDGVLSLFLQKASSYAVFGQATWYLTPDWAVIGGLRFGTENKDASLDITPYGPGITGAILNAEDFDTRLQRREKELSPKLGLRYVINDEISTYLTWTQGYKSGGFNAISFNSSDLEFEPERADAYELGMKGRFFDESLALNVSVYQTMVSNMQVVNFNGVGFDVFNAAEAELQGLEIDLKWLPPWPWLTLDAALGISSAEYLDYADAPAPNGQGDADGKQDLSGRTLPKAPVSSASLRPTVSLPLYGDLGIQFGVDLSYRGRQYLTLDLDERSRQDAYTLLGARIIVGPEDGPWALVLGGNNLQNTKALNFVADHNLYANSYFANQIPERNISLSFSTNW